MHMLLTVLVVLGIAVLFGILWDMCLSKIVSSFKERKAPVEKRMQEQYRNLSQNHYGLERRFNALMRHLNLKFHDNLDIEKGGTYGGGPSS